ncbi:MAG: hypothetical protein M1824_000751 [Vezdaea acicularis]|nr:MAG: hypothetical protein M1824_000751 [Vezdaea acicularis]
MASIEPRLTALLDDTSMMFRSFTPQNLEFQLPPIHEPISSHTSSRPPPLEPNASLNRDSHASTSKLSNSGSGAKSRRRSKDGTIRGPAAARSPNTQKEPQRSKSPSRLVVPLDLHRQSSFEDFLDLDWNTAPRKRQKIEEAPAEKAKVKLPVLQKKTPPSRLPTVPAISDLKTPPPNAALFPPITPSPFEDAHGRHTLNATSSPKGDNDTSSTPKNNEKSESSTGGKRATKQRRKWTAEETEHLLKGVARHGLGKWKKILEDTDFRFDDRSAIDLKDRFRTCCPSESQKKSTSSEQKSGPVETPILSPSSGGNPSIEPTDKPKARRARESHRLNPEDLVKLGISAPFEKATRRSRHPFTDEDDADLLAGYEVHGPQWSKIRDKSTRLERRRATDLRDRFRNRFPERYKEAAQKAKTGDLTPTEEDLSKPTLLDPRPILEAIPSAFDLAISPLAITPLASSASLSLPPAITTITSVPSLSDTLPSSFFDLPLPPPPSAPPTLSSFPSFDFSPFVSTTVDSTLPSLPTFSFPDLTSSSTETAFPQSLLTHIPPLATYAPLSNLNNRQFNARADLATDFSKKSNSNGNIQNNMNFGLAPSSSSAMTLPVASSAAEKPLAAKTLSLPSVGEVVGEEWDVRRGDARREMSLAALVWDDMGVPPFFDP